MTARHELPTPGPAMAIATSIAAMVPILSTERLSLRAPVLTDFPTFAEIVCGPRGKYVGGPMSRDDAWCDFAGMCSCWMLHGHGGWAIKDIKGQETMGFVVLGLEPGDQEVELGFLLSDTAEGRGIATEAALAVRNWAASELRLTGLVSYIDPGNARSVRLAERLGAVRDAAAEAAFDEPICVYRHPKEAIQ